MIFIQWKGGVFSVFIIIQSIEMEYFALLQYTDVYQPDGGQKNNLWPPPD